MEENINNVKSEYLDKIKQAGSLKQLDEIFLSLFGKNGAITLLPKQFQTLTKDELKIIGPLFNQTKQSLERELTNKRSEIREEGYEKLENEKATLTSTYKIKDRVGQIHPVIKFEEEIIELFSKLGFQRFDAPHIDTDYYNFELLNIPPGHPARDLWDTLYIDIKNISTNSPGKLLLRTHTSNAQIRIMGKYKPPIRMLVVDRCFRYENLDARHEHTLDQFELVYIDKGVSMANLQYLSEYFLRSVFGQDIKVRLRPKYYPFVEPGVGVDGMCIFCKGAGCNICGQTGWLELAGAGMIHPTVLKNGGINPEEYQGIAWGFGPERMAMLKFEVNDIRVFKNADLKELKKISL